jgi:hypothetical protein
MGPSASFWRATTWRGGCGDLGGCWRLAVGLREIPGGLIFRASHLHQIHEPESEGSSDDERMTHATRGAAVET